MSTIRLEKVARLIKEAVSDAVAHHLNDPRIEGFVSVTRVDVAPNMRRADVYLSVFGGDLVKQKKTFLAITHARSKIQSLLSRRIKSKFCPVLHFHEDEVFKKTMETLNLIDKAVSELDEDDSGQEDQDQ